MARTSSKNSAIAVPPMDAIITFVSDMPVCDKMKRGERVDLVRQC